MTFRITQLQFPAMGYQLKAHEMCKSSKLSMEAMQQLLHRRAAIMLQYVQMEQAIVHDVQHHVNDVISKLQQICPAFDKPILVYSCYLRVDKRQQGISLQPTEATNCEAMVWLVMITQPTKQFNNRIVEVHIYNLMHANHQNLVVHTTLAVINMVNLVLRLDLICNNHCRLKISE